MIKIFTNGFDKNATYKKVAFTGHRPDKLGGYKHLEIQSRYLSAEGMLKKVCASLVMYNGTDEFMVGMAQGIDQLAAKIVLNIIKEQNLDSCDDAWVNLHAAIPFDGQESVWPEEAQNEYHRILKLLKASNKHILHPMKPATKPDAIKWLQERNKYMIDWCDLLVAVWDGTPGGTCNAIDYAKEVGKPILLLRFI